MFLDIKFPYLKQGLVSWVWCSRDCRVCQGQGFHICGEITCKLGVCASDIVHYLFCCPYLLVWSMLTIVIKDETLKCWFSSFKPQSLALPLLFFAVPSSSTVSLHASCHCGCQGIHQSSVSLVAINVGWHAWTCRLMLSPSGLFLYEHTGYASLPW